ncbi:hypothetical protein [Kribbella sp. CA-294648]|uniref:hypothetical protein n=1 Tax=Kribbella sp. CA-294648 TaxID=3239948 RepID=UPI003D919747
MAVMQVVDVVLVLDGLATVTVGVWVTMAGVHLGFRVPLPVVHVVHVITVQHCRATVIWQMLVIEILDMCGH